MIKRSFFINFKKCWGSLAIVTCFLLSIFLTILPLPEWMRHLWPLSTVLLVVFGAVYLPQVINPWLVWIMGILMDVAEGDRLGEHALAFIVVYFFALYINRQIRGLSLLIQSMSIGIILLFYQGFMIVTQNVPVQQYIFFLFPVLTSLILWPSLFFIMRAIAMRFYIQHI
jgi:rod shape-determining protein MreD